MPSAQVALRAVVQRAGERPRTRLGWLDSSHSFSFGSHYDPDNLGHGLLIVNNDVPALHRVHEAPDVKKVGDFEAFISTLGYSLGATGVIMPRVVGTLRRGPSVPAASRGRPQAASFKGCYPSRNRGH